MSSTEYDAHFFEKTLFFWRHIFRHENLRLWNTTVKFFEHNCHISGTKPPHLQKLSNLGVQIGTATISAIGQADDSALLSNNIHSLSNLLLPTI